MVSLHVNECSQLLILFSNIAQIVIHYLLRLLGQLFTDFAVDLEARIL